MIFMTIPEASATHAAVAFRVMAFSPTAKEAFHLGISNLLFKPL
jgi:hypothetical protein